MLRTHSYRKAPEDGPLFVLASGKVSNHFIDVKTTALRAAGIYVLGDALVRVLRDFEAATMHEGPIQYLAGVALGGCPLVTAASLCGLRDGWHRDVLYVRKAAKDHGTAKLIEGHFEKNARTVLLEDVATTGGSSLKAIEILKEAGLQVPAVIAVVDREEGAQDVFEAAGVKFISLVKLSEISE